VGSFTGAVFGTAVLPVAGSLLGAAGGAFATAFGCEYFLSRQRGRALRIAWAAAKNHLWGMLGKLLAGIIMFLLLARALFIL
jgi:uncharacterized protein YqgC (DUF456 family)